MARKISAFLPFLRKPFLILFPRSPTSSPTNAPTGSPTTPQQLCHFHSTCSSSAATGTDISLTLPPPTPSPSRITSRTPSPGLRQRGPGRRDRVQGGRRVQLRHCPASVRCSMDRGLRMDLFSISEHSQAPTRSFQAGTTTGRSLPQTASFRLNPGGEPASLDCKSLIHRTG